MQDILLHARQQLPGALAVLERMVNMDSPSSDKALVDGFARFAAGQFEALGGSGTFIPAERLGDHLLVRFGEESGRRILLLGHTDTVFPSGEAARRPFRIEGTTAKGPGVFDMKGGIALMWLALSALQAQGGKTGGITVLLTSDEEIGSPSSRDLIQAEALKAHAVLVLEPSLPGGALKTARKGSGRFTIKAVGRAAHAGIDPEKGINAIEEIAAQVLRLHRISDPQSGTTITVGVIQGGTRSNVIPAEAAIEVDVRISTAQEAERITRLIRSLQPEVAGARLEVRGGINRPPMERTADTAKLFSLAREVAADLGVDLQEGSTGGASDGNLTAAFGAPTLDGLGPVGTGAHSLDEAVDIPSLPVRAALVAGLILKLGAGGLEASGIGSSRGGRGFE
jgi:glutamate carboxypeptidase